MPPTSWNQSGSERPLRRLPGPGPEQGSDVPAQHNPGKQNPAPPFQPRPDGQVPWQVLGAGEGDRWSSLERPPLDQSALRRSLLEPLGPFARVDVVDTVGSTNADLLREAEGGGVPDLSVLAADYQYAGRGRLNRTWQAPACTSVAASIALRPGPLVPLSTWPWLPLLAGLAITEALQKVAGVNAGLKWPNDVLVAFGGEPPGKVCGILAETFTSPEGPGVVLGFGVNVLQSRDELPVPTATSLALARAVVTDRSTILRACLRSFASWYQVWRDAAGSPALSGIPEAVRGVCLTLGQKVVVDLPGGGHMEGVAEDLDEDGRLLIRTSEGRFPVGAGDVQHVRSR